eukprot:7375989-Prymnesium_polylepis.1
MHGTGARRGRLGHPLQRRLPSHLPQPAPASQPSPQRTQPGALIEGGRRASGVVRATGARRDADWTHSAGTIVTGRCACVPCHVLSFAELPTPVAIDMPPLCEHLYSMHAHRLVKP